LKVSDEFTVPLCAIHHHHIHPTGNERSWWQERNIDPLKVAFTFWQQSRERQAVPPRGDAGQGNVSDDRETQLSHQASSEIDGNAGSVRDP
jgi:hypothetical protein